MLTENRINNSHNLGYYLYTIIYETVVLQESVILGGIATFSFYHLYSCSDTATVLSPSLFLPFLDQPAST
jgi:hypothetical protein